MRAPWCILLAVVTTSPAFAECMGRTSDTIIFHAKSCEVISPKTTPQLKNYDRAKYGETEAFLDHFYTGALVVDEHGQQLVYPSPKADVCAEFPLGEEVTKGISSTCCDTGAWGKCIFGGNFLYDVGSKPVNSFQ